MCGCVPVLRFKVDPSVSLSEIVERCPVQLTGADLYALCSDAMMSAIKRKILHVTEGALLMLFIDFYIYDSLQAMKSIQCTQ